MLRPLLHHETPWSWRSLLPSAHRGGHRWMQRVLRLPQLPLPPPPPPPPSFRHRTIGSTRRLSSLHNPQSVPTPRNAAVEADRAGWDRSSRPEQAELPAQDSLRQALLVALRSDDPERLLEIAVKAFRNDELVKSLRPTTISQIFESLRFEGLLREHGAIAQVLKPGAISAARGVGWEIRNIRQVIERINEQFATLFHEWMESGRRIDLPKCKSYLRFLSAAGQAKEARSLRSLCEKHGIGWDTEAYNLFLEALCWEDYYLPDEFGKFRVTSANLADRARKESGISSRGYTSAIRDEVMDAFEEMVVKGCAADVRTFSLVMVSMGRIGDLDGIEATLNRIWGVDVSSLAKGASFAMYFENDMQHGAPLYPDEHLLFVVAHVYGSNNSLSMAMKVVDFISQKYSVTIDLRTWEELAKWAFVLGRRRGGSVTLSEHKASLQRGESAGKVPQATFMSLWRTMTSGRYKITPKLHMFNLLFSTLYGRSEVPQMARLLLYGHQRLGLGHSYAKLVPEASSSGRRSSHASLTELERLKALAASVVFLRWVRLLLHGSHFEGRNERLSDSFYYRRLIPNFIAEWGNLWFGNTTSTFHYRSSVDGRVTFHRQMTDENQTPMEIFPAAPQDTAMRYIVRPKSPCMSLPFQEIGQGERRQNRLERDLAYGKGRRYMVRPEWSEQPTVADWIWLASGKGVRLEGGRFESRRFEDELKDPRKLVFPSHAFDRLGKDQAIEIRQRLLLP